MAALRSFSILGCTATFGGYTLSGFGPDDCITIEPSNAAFEEVVGADGDLSTYQKPVTYKVKLTLAQTSKTNDIMSAVHLADKQTGGGVLPFVFRDQRGTTLCNLTASRIMGEPTASHGTSAGTREWNISGVGTNFIGGN